MNDV
jgi:large subunit ribosomal protein L24e